MKKLFSLILLCILSITFLLFLVLRTEIFWEKGNPDFSKKRFKSVLSQNANYQMIKAYSEQFFEMFRDPSSNTIPDNIKESEQRFLKTYQKNNKTDIALSTSYTINWQEAGPNDVAGRTRALAVDVKNSNIIIAGGVSGGLWKSTDHGKSWKIKSQISKSHSVTALAQDTREGYTNIWYYGTGEYRRNSVLDQVLRNWYWGDGLFKSTDNGESWELLENTKCNPDSKHSYFNFISKIVVSPINGYVFVASNEQGILRSTNGGKNFEFVLGGTDSYYYTDVATTSDGKIIAFLSQYGTHHGRQITPGIYLSLDNGNSWNNKTPGSFPAYYQRTVLATTPVNNNIVYSLTYTGIQKSNGSDDLRLYKIYLNKDSVVNKSANLPDNPELTSSRSINTQDCYNMVIAVKPDDEDYVIVGGTSLYRSLDGFDSKEKNGYKILIGGYHPKADEYPNQHPDEHIIAFDPTDPNKMWSGHDGGLSFASNINLSCDSANPLPWEKMNNGYNVTQFYSVAFYDSAGDTRLMGGTQDNGSPYFRFDGKKTTKSLDVSGGDGTFGYFGQMHLFSSVYFGMVFRVPYDKSGEPDMPAIWNCIWPQNAQGQLFFNTFSLDPNNENIMYYPSGNTFWRNSNLSAIPEDYRNGYGTTINWSKLDKLNLSSAYRYTAITVSKSNPKHVLYAAASCKWENPQYPIIYKLENCDESIESPINVSIPNAPKGSYVNCIAVNPDDANEVIVVLSNYNIIGLYHTLDGGINWTPIEGNLAGDENNLGPALTTASILPTEYGNLYLVGSTVGVFSTMQLNGMETFWRMEGDNSFGNILIYDIKSRKADGMIAVATWGRGIFVGKPDFSTSVVSNSNFANAQFESIFPNPTQNSIDIVFSLNNTQKIKIEIIDILGSKVKTIYNRITEPAKHELHFSVSDLPNGFYFVKLSTDSRSYTKSLIIGR